MKGFSLIFFLFTFLPSCKKLTSNTRVKGYVYNAYTKQPIKDVEVGYYKGGLFNKIVKDKTNKKGKYSICTNSNIGFEIGVFQVLEQLQGSQYEAHDLICIDSNSCGETYYVSPGGGMNTIFF